MIGFRFNQHLSGGETYSSKLYDEQSFYGQFMRDLRYCKTEAIIESPFITGSRIASLLPIFTKMRSRNIPLIVNTRHPSEHDTPYDQQAWDAIRQLQSIGARVLFTGGHHRKLAVLDRRVLWEGSLNILSQYDSCEVMRRTQSEPLAAQMLDFIEIKKCL